MNEDTTYEERGEPEGSGEPPVMSRGARPVPRKNVIKDGRIQVNCWYCGHIQWFRGAIPRPYRRFHVKCSRCGVLNPLALTLEEHDEVIRGRKPKPLMIDNQGVRFECHHCKHRWSWRPRKIPLPNVRRKVICSTCGKHSIVVLSEDDFQKLWSVLEPNYAVEREVTPVGTEDKHPKRTYTGKYVYYERTEGT